jgi:hypothetical protein
MNILTKEAIKKQAIIQYAITQQDQRHIIKMYLMKEWQNIWDQTKLTTPIKHYKEVQPHVHIKPWYNKNTPPPSIIRSITRKLYHNPLCENCNTDLFECEVMDTIQHRMLECINK